MPAALAAYSGGVLGSNTLSMSVPFPAVTAGQLLLVLVATNGGTGTISTTSSGWTKTASAAGGSGTLGSQLTVFTGTGGDAQTPMVVTSSSSTQFAAYSITVNGADLSIPPTCTFANSASGQLNSPSVSLPLPRQYAVISWGCSAYGQAAYLPTTAPTGYTGPYRQTGSTGVGGVGIIFAFKSTEAASEDPGAFAGGTVAQWNACTIGIPSAVTVRQRGSFAHLIGSA